MSQDPKLSRSPDYYAARAAEERSRAMASADQKARAIHLEMAEKYDKLASGEGSRRQQLTGDQQNSA